MPLAFHSLSHGTIAFGFFNIETDLLLLDRYFFFATEFCEHIQKMTDPDHKGPYEDIWPIYEINEPDNIGDLMGAIHGIRFTGFIGTVYQHFPFPTQPAAFKQKPYGVDNQSILRTMIDSYAEKQEITVSIPPDNSEIAIGTYRFERTVFQQLIAYVWRGGYPRWLDDSPPDYVAVMKSDVLNSNYPMFEGIEKVYRTTMLEK